MKVIILQTMKSDFINKDTGEQVGYTKTTIGTPADTTDKFSGYILEEITGSIKDFEVIKNYVGKSVDVELEYKKVDKKNFRQKLKSINGAEISTIA